MAEPRLRIVDELFAETPLPPDATEQQKKRREIDMATVARYVPAITKRARAATLAELEQKLGSKTIEDIGLLPEIRKDHKNELVSLQLHFDDAQVHVKSAAYHRGVKHTGIFAVLLAFLVGYGAYVFGVETQVNTVSAMRAVNAPRGWAPPESPSVRDVPRCDSLPCDAVEDAR